MFIRCTELNFNKLLLQKLLDFLLQTDFLPSFFLVYGLLGQGMFQANG